MLTGRPVSIIGGGIAGLSAAFHLKRLCPDRSLVLFESTDRLGGRIRTDAVQGYVVEDGPDSFVTQKPAALELCRAIGLEDQLVHPADHLGPAYVRRGHDLHRLPEGLSGLVPARLAPLFRSSVLSLRGRLRVAMEPLIPRRHHADESLHSFLRRRFGREAATNLFAPLFGGIYGPPDQLSARTVVPNLMSMEEAFGSVLRGIRAGRGDLGAPGKLASLAGGMGVLPDRMRSVLAEMGVDIRLETPVDAVTRSDGRYEVFARGAPIGEVDGVIVAIPPGPAAVLLSEVAPTAAGALRGIETTSSAIVSLGFPGGAVERTLDATGYVVAGSSPRCVTACTWSSVKFPGRAPSGHGLFRVFFGGDHLTAPDSPSDDVLLQAALDELHEIVGLRAGPDLTMVHRHPNATPRLTVGHRDRVGTIESALGDLTPALAVAGNCYTGVGLADAAATGRRAAEVLAGRTQGR